MKNYYLLILTLLLSVSTFASSGKDSLSVAKKSTASSLYANPAVKGLDAEAIKRLAAFKAKRAVDQAGSSYALRKYETKQFRSFPELESAVAPAPSANFFKGLAEFTKDYIKKIYKPTPKTDSLVGKAKELFEEIKKQENFINIISGKELLEFPVGLKKQVSPSSSITIGIVKAKLHANYAEVDLFAKLELGELNTELFFGASNVKLSHQGGIYGEAQLNLLGDFPVGQNGGQWIITFKGGLESDGSSTNQTYIKIDCTGKVSEIALEADVRIAKTVAIPLDDNGKKKFPGQTKPQDGKSPAGNDSYVGASFSIVAESLQDLLIELNLPKFELKPLPGWGFEMKNVVLDLSDTKNSPLVKFPKIYDEQQLLLSDQKEIWRGFYGEEVTITMPPQFKILKSNKRITFGAKGLLIDNFGVSGEFFATNLINLNQGNASKWQFSVDSLNIDLQVNRFIKAGFNGKIVLPISKSDSTGNGSLSYHGLITADDKYNVRVDVEEDVDFNIFKSKAKLFPESYIKLEVENGKFYPEANLSGLMAFNKSQKASMDTISSTNKNSNVNDIESLEFEGLSFQNFKIQTRTRPYLHIQYMGFKDTLRLPKIYGFELGMYDVKVKSEGDKAVIGLNSYINLDKSGIKGDVRLRVIGKLEEGDFLKWKYEKIEVDSISVDVKRKSFELTGKLYFFRDDPTYGKGLEGKVDLYSEGLNLQMESRAIFGRKEDYRYWFVDTYGRPAKSKNKNFEIFDIGGALYHHMDRSGFGSDSKSLTGIKYTPDKSVGFGFKALAAFQVKKSATFTGLVAIEMSFNSKSQGGGVRRIGFYGAGALMDGDGYYNGLSPFGTVEDMQAKVVDKEKGFKNISLDKEGLKYYADKVFPDMLTGNEKFAAQVAIDFDFKNKTYWGMFDVFLNLGVFKGAGEKNRFGYLEFYNSPTDWYLYVGTPTKRFGLKDLPIGVFDAKINVYFMTGTILPDPALPPANVIDILDLSGDELLFGRNFNNGLAQGVGYAFGAEFALGKSYDWGIIYASVQAGVGFDLMLRDFGETTCKGRSGKIGMDGWYATGQLYAYLQGEFGAQIKLFGMRKRVRILKAGLAVLAQGQLPNPWFVKGYAGVKIRVLGVGIKARLKVTIGEECEMIGKTGVQELNVISDIVPEDGRTKIDVFDAVQVAFNFPVNDIVEVEGDAGITKYRIYFEELTIKEGNNEIQGKVEWNNTKDQLIFEPDDLLPSEKKITVTVKVRFDEKKPRSSWQPVLNNGTPAFETKTATFTTGKAPTNIAHRNIEKMYPVIGQRYLLPKETSKGYAQLKKGQDYLFGQKGYKDELYFVTESGQAIKSNFAYNNASNTLSFSIPKLPNRDQIVLKLVTSKENTGSGTANNKKEVYVDSGDGVSVTSNKIDGTVTNTGSYTRLEFGFGTSKYNTFKEKVKAMDIKDYYTFIDGQPSAGGLGLAGTEFEPFDINEVRGTNYTDNTPFIVGKGLLTDTYFNNEIYPLVYKPAPYYWAREEDRNYIENNVVPVYNIKVSNAYRELVLSNPEHSHLKKNFPFTWNLAAAYRRDFIGLRSGVTGYILKNPPVEEEIYNKFKYIIEGNFPYINIETYKVEFEYKLPHENTGSKTIIKYKNYF